jgi:hypothetical protein
MPAEEHPRHDQEEMAEEHSFDELAKGLVKGSLTRGQALKLLGASILSSLVGSGVLGIVPEVASAKPPRHRRRGRHHKKPKTTTTLPPGQTCDSTNCAGGCCVNINTCHTNDPQFCGTGAGSCVRCADNVACVSGVCQPGPPPPPCSASNCLSGCCENNTCHQGDPAACGTGGGTCTNCGSAAGVSCVSGGCVQPPPTTCGPTNTSGTCPRGQRCVGGACVCDSMSCANGCCSNGECHTNDPTACGSGGGNCRTCPPNTECQNNGSCGCEPATNCTGPGQVFDPVTCRCTCAAKTIGCGLTFNPVACPTPGADACCQQYETISGTCACVCGLGCLPNDASCTSDADCAAAFPGFSAVCLSGPAQAQGDPSCGCGNERNFCGFTGVC